jgi:hypothetical protein
MPLLKFVFHIEKYNCNMLCTGIRNVKTLVKMSLCITKYCAIMYPLLN